MRKPLMSFDLSPQCNSVLVVDDDPIIVTIIDEILNPLFRVKVALNGETAIHIAASATPPDLILLDVVMPKMDGYEVLAILKKNPATSHIPVLFLTSNADENSEMRAFDMGAVDFIAKPVNTRLVLARVRAQMALTQHNRILEHTVRLRTQELKELQLEIIQRLCRAAEFKDNDTGLHVVRMSHYSRLLAQAAGIEGDALDNLFNAAAMHDIGKIGIPDHVLTKPQGLNSDEWFLMKKHPEFGAKILGEHPSPLLHCARTVALTHHEKWNGSGYPQGLQGEKIPLEGRIVAVADVFDALTTKRPYKPAWNTTKAVELLLTERSRHFDPKLVDLFIDMIPAVTKIQHQFTELDN